MSEANLVSVITPCYNGEKFIRETIESVLAQTFPVMEMIVVDDGSTDHSSKIAESFGEPVRVIKQENQGESVARNRGISEALGSHLLFLDADDLLHPESLERLCGAIQGNNRAVALMGYSLFLDEDRTTIRTIQPEVEDFIQTICSRNPGAPHCYLTPAEIVKQAGGFCDSLVYFEDWDFWCQVALTGAPLITVDFVGAFYRRHANAQTPNASKIDRKLGHVRVIERFLDGLLKDSELTKKYGETAFWSAWAALRSSRELGIAWSQLKPLGDNTLRLLHAGPDSLRNSRFGRLSRLFGLRVAMTMQKSIGGDIKTKDGELIQQLQKMRAEQST